MKLTGRWEDWAALAAGITVVISWIWHGMIGPPTAVMFLVGVGTAFSAVLSITRPGLIATEAVMFVLGVLLFVLPWLLEFTHEGAAAWTAWILGPVIAVLGVIGVPMAIAAHGRPATR
ncbi:MAG: SPW repeat protein [Nocardiopsaceae bacterium]|nr:SPW repeat protein [Nocardiopsaceae bacterium]